MEAVAVSSFRPSPLRRPRFGDRSRHRSCSWKVLGLERRRRTSLYKTRCENRDDVGATECSTSCVAANSSSLETLSSASPPAAPPPSSSIAGAFCSMVVMLRSVQSFALLSRSHEADSASILAAVQSDLHCSFLWLFQQVFAKTPGMMLSLMVILANFVALSASGGAALEVEVGSSSGSGSSLSSSSSSSGKTKKTSGSSSSEVFISGPFANPVSPSSDDEELFMVSMLEQAAEELKVDNGGRSPHSVEIAPASALVAPVSVQLESDNYDCFDRTELLYQEALGADRDNPLILANYAEFLFLVRRDYARAREVFHLAVRADRDDAEILCRYGKFLWLAFGNRRAAEEAYRAAMAAEPSNPFYAGCYAHFLWHSGEDYGGAARLAERARKDHLQS